ncbi:MAG: potassium transporter TrkA [Methylomonas sp.]|nr:MAG: potassium transporter TrkA [Methylomonas sp.]
MKRIALFGYSQMAFETMHRLNPEQYQIVFVVKDPTQAAQALEQGFEANILDFRNDDDLKAIGIGGDIEVLFCFFPKDSDNVFLTISARALDPALNIIAIVDDPDSAEKLLAAGADKIIDPYEICGTKTHQMLIKPEITNILDETVFGQHDLNIAQIEIPCGSTLENCRISRLNLQQKHHLLVIGVVDKDSGEELHFLIGEPEINLQAGDVLVVMGSNRQIKAFAAEVSQSCGSNSP